MKNFTLLLTVAVLSSCYQTVHYVSMVPEENYELYFLNENMQPISGISEECKFVEIGKTFEESSTVSYFSASTISGENGRLVVNQRNHKEGGSYNSVGSYIWGEKHSAKTSAVCRFFLSGKIIYSASMEQYKGIQKNIVYIQK